MSDNQVDTRDDHDAKTITGNDVGRFAPTTFTIETSLLCNLKCPECALGGKMIDRKKGLLPFDRFRIIADKIRPFARLIYLHLWGEPMLNPDIISMINYAAPFAYTHISTNALTLDERKAKELISSGVSEILVSIDGVSQEVYELYRIGGVVKKAFESLKMLQDINTDLRAGVQIVPQFIVFKHNQHEMNDFKQICNDIGLEPFFKAPYIRNGHSRYAYTDDPRYVRPHFRTVEAMRRAMTKCPNPKNVFTILLDGSVVACCHDYGCETCFGNIFEQNVLEIWNSHAFKKFRWDVLSGNAPQFCIQKCMTYFLDNSIDKRADSGPVKANPTNAPPWTDNKKKLKPDQTVLKRMDHFHRLDIEDPSNRDFFSYVLGNPQELGLHDLEMEGKGKQQKKELILGEYFFQVARRAGKIASDLLFNGQWAHETPEWFDHRHHLLNPEKWFKDFWAASADNVIPVLPLNGKMLNLCSGDGFYDYYFFRQRASQIICVEKNDEAYRMARRLHCAENISYIKDDVLTWNPPESYFDVAVIRGAIEHFTPVDQQALFRKVFRALKPGGWFCGDTPAKKTGGKHLSWHEHEWADESEMRNALSTSFDHVQTGSLTSRETVTLFWRCQKQ